ncbi:MAG: hypothetical protein PHU49_01245 [Syntrophorhabdaceae bacterium]|nr:hypothetical protein [Syntrophorhabdaceae bacterium]MDD5242616.1 hypothetical protein [Syntrophorhabdaceae bacterium]
MIFWILGAVAIFLVLRFLWRAYTHPAHTLGRQAANMNWNVIGRMNSEEGFKDVCLGRDGIEVRISHARGQVFLLKPVHSTPFKDFVELERWLAREKVSLSEGNEQTTVPQEVKEALSALDEAGHRFQTEAFKMVRHMIEKSVSSNPEALISMIRESGGRTPREWVYSQIGNIAGDLLESGQYHIYRGVLNPMGPGNDLLKMFDATYDELLLLKAVDADYAKEQKAALRRGLQGVG